MSCYNCSFWVKDDIGDDGQCRRYPPQTHMVPITGMLGQQGLTQLNVMTRTNKDYWCGEFKPIVN